MKQSIHKYQKLIGHLPGPLCYMHDSLVLHINRRVLIDLTNTQLQTTKEKRHFTALENLLVFNESKYAWINQDFKSR